MLMISKQRSPGAIRKLTSGKTGDSSQPTGTTIIMSEEDAEIALLHQMQAENANGSWEEGGDDQVSGDDSNTEHNIETVKKENVADDHVLRALSSSGADGVDNDDRESSATPQPTVSLAVPESRSSSRSSTRKPKTVGGFVADDSDEDDDDDASSSDLKSTALQVPHANPSTRTLSPSPLHNSVTQEDMNASEERTGPKSGSDPSLSLPVNPSGVGGAFVPALAVQKDSAPAASAQPKARLPHDTLGLLEDRIKEDPRGDLDAWLTLVNEYRSRSKFDEAREVYERFLRIFPQAAEIWVAYVEMELDNDNFTTAEGLFSRSLLSVLNIELWSVYLNYIRRRNDLTSDPTGTARTTISQSYDFVLSNIGIDRDAGKLWQEYIQFVRSAPGQIGGSGWQDQQKMDQVRKAYQRAITVPMGSVNSLWKEYDQFENGLAPNKTTGRKFLQEKSPAYMSARSANTALENITRGLIRTTLPKLPPVAGFDGDQEYVHQVEIWKKWIAWEQEDPLVLQADEVEDYKKRILYVFKQAVMALRFWPEIWVEAAEWCFANDLEKEGETFLDDGITANPESCLIAFKKADRLEGKLATEDADKGPAERGAIVRAPFDKLLNSLYELLAQLKERENKEMAKLEESLALDASISAIISRAEDEDEESEADKAVREAAKDVKTKAIEGRYASQTRVMWRTISFAWIALMRAMRRIQGKGAVKDVVGGSRQIFADARARGKITSDVYVASALIEHHVYKDPAGTKIFERGAKLFPEDEVFILEYLKHLLSTGDTTNARVAFETAVSRLTPKGAEHIAKTKPLYAYFHKYESQYGELAQIAKLEARMSELFPDDPKLARFASRYSAEGFDPTAVRPIISPITQLRPKGLMQSIEKPMSVADSPRPQYIQPEASPRPSFLQVTNSPKRPLPIDDLEAELNRPRKLARGESPLKGAAGRRLNQQKALQGPNWQSNAPPFVVPRDITFLLSIIPRAEFYHSTKFNVDGLVHLLTQTNVPDHATWKATVEPPPQSQQAPPPPLPQHVPQYYDGTRSSYTQPPQNLPPKPGQAQSYGQGPDWTGNEWTPGTSNAPPGAQYPGYQGADTSVWPSQGPPPQPGYSQGGYGAPVSTPAQTEAPYAQLPQGNWYYDGANGPPGYNPYGR